jgi:cellulose biosynthesis protein BcsQ
MLSYTVYSEGGGVGKSTLAYNLAKAHARAGLNVLVIPLDPQDGGLSLLAGVDENREDMNKDHLVRHLVEREKGPIEDLIRTTEPNIDVIPEHDVLERLDEALTDEEDSRGNLGESFPRNTQLKRVIRENELFKDYDVLICDPPATSGPHLYNAIAATGNLVLPIEPSEKGKASITGLKKVVDNLSRELEMDIRVLAAIPNGFKGTNDQTEILEEVDELGYDTPEIIGVRGSLFEGSWREHCSAFNYVRDHRSRQRDYEIETLAQLDRIARHLEEKFDIEAPNPPEPGELKEPMEVSE